MAENHPEIDTKVLQQAYYELELQLKREKFKPKLKGKYYRLLSSNNELTVTAVMQPNHTFGLGFSYPLFLRSASGDLQKTQVKLMANALDIANKTNELTNKLQNSLLQVRVLRRQINLTRQTIAGYKQLLSGENEKFNQWESSFFLLNKRQEKYMLSQLKLIELTVKKQHTVMEYLFNTGRLAF